MSAEDILRLLADGEFHSLQWLAEQAAVGEDAILQQIPVLGHRGVTIEHTPGRGYRLPGGLDLLDEAAILRALPDAARALLGRFELHGSIDSTNAQLRRETPGLPGASVCLAESQTDGRGRRGRSWTSPFGSNIYLSVAWRFHAGAERLEGLSLAVGVVLCDTLAALGVAGLALKWPNDVLLDGRKLAGILIEMRGGGCGPCDAVIGIGVNVRMPAAAGASIEQPWADLGANNASGFSRSLLVASLLGRLLPALAAYEESGFSAWRTRWEALDAYAGRSVVIDNNGRRMAGEARGVDDQGALLLQTATATQSIHAGEVSLRLSGEGR